MADLTRIQFKRSKTPNVRPAPDTVAEGEIVLNLADRAILTKLGNEIIDLGFAKGGKVDGNIDLTGNFTQTNGNITTTGSITAGAESSFTDINATNSIKIKSKTTEDFGSITFYDGKFYFEQYINGKWTGQLGIPQGAGTLATQGWTARMIDTDDNTTFVRNPNGDRRLCLVSNDAGEAGAYDFANGRWAFVHNQAGFEVFGPGQFKSTGDYASIVLKKSDGRFVQIETKPHAGSTDMLNFIYRQADGTNQHVMSLPYETGTVASREWVNKLIYLNNEDVIIKHAVDLASPAIILHQNDSLDVWSNKQQRNTLRLDPYGALTTTGAIMGVNEVGAMTGETRLHLKTEGNVPQFVFRRSGGGWNTLNLPPENGTVASREWVSNSNQTYNAIINLKADNGSSSPITLRNWGSGDRKTVIEVGDSSGYYFYSQRHGNGTIRLDVNGTITYNNQSATWISMRDQPCLQAANMIATGSASTIIRQEHQDRHYMLGGLGNSQFGIYMINKNHGENSTNGTAYMDQNGGWNCNGGYAATTAWVNSQGFLKNGSQGTKLGGLNYGPWVRINSANDQKYVATQAMVQLMTSVPDNAVFVKCQNQNIGSTTELRTVYRYITQL